MSSGIGPGALPMGYKGATCPPRPAEMGPQASLNQQIFGVTEQILQPQV